MNKKNICIVTTSLGVGGAERSSALLSQLLFNLDYTVSVVVTKNIIEYNYSGNLFNLELELKGEKGNISKLKVLKAYFSKNKFDYIIDNRTRSSFLKEFFLYRYVFFGANIIPIVHSCNIENYMPKSKFLANFLYGNIYNLVVVSEKIKKKIEYRYRLKNLVRIYNSIDFNSLKSDKKKIKLPGKPYVLYFGRIEEAVKNLTLLINGYRKSKLIQKGVKLVILGDGPDLESTKNKVSELNIAEHVIFIPFNPNPFPFVKEALFTVLTSKYEGFPMSIVESLALRTPVVSVDCDSGPSEIIKNKENGLLIKNNDVKALADAFNLFIENEDLYLYCKKKTIESIKHLQINEVALQWKKLIDDRN